MTVSERLKYISLVIFILSFSAVVSIKLMTIFGVTIHTTYMDCIEISSFFIMIISLGFSIRKLISDKVQDNTDKFKTLEELHHKNVYLEHAAKILRHDMHSGINTYIPRGVKSLLRRLGKENVHKLGIESPIRLITEGLAHTQQVYRGVYEFTNLVKDNAKIETDEYDLKSILKSHLKRTSYYDKIKINQLPTICVNESLFCTAVDNLIRNGLKYNDSDTKCVRIYSETIKTDSGITDNYIIIEDNGRGMTQEEFEEFSKPYVRRKGQTESGSGLGLNICSLILKEHGFSISCEKTNTGTKLMVKI